MDFFLRQDQARRNTILLVTYFALGVVLIIAAVYLVVILIFDRPSPENLAQFNRIWNPNLLLGAAAGTMLVILGGSLQKISALRQGGGSVASSLGGTRINPDTNDPDERRLLNVVEEMAIASGIPVPEVYLLKYEEGINAFAAGNSISDAAVGVTRGTLTMLSRDELQGVIAHEFSHILNGDMRLNLRLMGIVHGILCLSLIGRILLRTRGRKNPLPLLGLALLLIGSVGVFCGRLIKSAISREREFLADAAAVQFTRYPQGLAGALKKIGGMSYGSRLKTVHAEEASHLFFSNALAASWLKWTSTHPPLTQRILRLDSAFDGQFPKVELPLERPPVTQELDQTLLRRRPKRLIEPAPLANPVSQIGAPSIAHLAYAADLMSALPEELIRSTREPFSATALIYSLLFSRDEPTRAQQLQQLEKQLPPALVEATHKLAPSVVKIDPGAKLPLVELSLPALHRLSPAQFEQFGALIGQLSEADRQIDLFEYALRKAVFRHLEPHFRKVRKPLVHYYVLKPLVNDCAILLSGLAQASHEDHERVAAAFRSGAQQLNAPEADLKLLPFDQCNLAQIDAALDHLSQAAPMLKKQILNACVRAAAEDQVLQKREAELLRAIADTLDCPMPPLLDSSTAES